MKRDSYYILVIVICLVLIVGLTQKAFAWKTFAQADIPFEFSYPQALDVDVHYDYIGKPQSDELFPIIGVSKGIENVFNVSMYPAQANESNSDTEERSTMLDENSTPRYTRVIVKDGMKYFLEGNGKLGEKIAKTFTIAED